MISKRYSIESTMYCYIILNGDVLFLSVYSVHRLSLVPVDLDTLVLLVPSPYRKCPLFYTYL